MQLPLDHIAVVGYSLLLTFAAYKLVDTIRRPVDFTANLLLIVGLTALIAYHARMLRNKKDIDQDPMQKKLRLLAHSTLTTFLLLTLSPFSTARFQFYDWFALAGHSSLFYSVAKQTNQLVGIGMLTLYFFFATDRKKGMRGMELLNLLGRALLLLFFFVSFIFGAAALL
jgi:hypothetical protein